MANEFGELRVLRKLNKYEFEVSLRIMRSGLNRNRWDYQNLENCYQSFAGQPILCAFPNGRIGDGHTMEEKRDENGQLYYSFIGASSEKIVGTISDDVNDLHLVNENGETWLIAKGRLFAFYAKELVDNIVAKGVMEVSAETEIYEGQEYPDREVYTNWAGLGVTILGEGVEPAIPGARIEEFAAMRQEFNSVLLKAASYIKGNEEDPDEPDDVDDDDDVDDEPDDEEEDKEEVEPDDDQDEEDDVPEQKQNQNKTQKSTKKGESKTVKAFSKKQIAELSPKFDGYTVLSAGQDESGIHVALMAADGCTAVYNMETVDDMVDTGKIHKCDAQTMFTGEGWELAVDSCELTDTLSAAVITANAQLETANADLETAKSTIESMTIKEMKRRVSAAKAKALSTLEAFNANREEKIDSKILVKINEEIENGEFSECENSEGEWCGEEKVCEKVLAACASEVMEMDKQYALSRNSEFVWDSVNKRTPSGNNDVQSLLSKFGIK